MDIIIKLLVFLTIIIHLLIVFAIPLGVVYSIFRRSYAWKNFLLVAVVAFLDMKVFGYCPLTGFEKWLLSKCEGCVVYEDEFLVHWFGGLGVTDQGVWEYSLVVFTAASVLFLRWVVDKFLEIGD